MKKLYLLLFILPFLSSCGSLDYENIDVDGQKEKALNVYTNMEGNSISQKEFNKKTHQKDHHFTSYLYPEEKDGQWFLHNRLIKSIDTLTIDHQRLVLLLQNLTSKKLNHDSIIWLSYGFKDDFLSADHYESPYVALPVNLTDNTYFERLKKKYPAITFLQFFEKDIPVKNNPENAEEYVFRDQNNILRKIIFKDAANYGSSAIIKPNGEVLLLNGEHMNPHKALAYFLTRKKWN